VQTTTKAALNDREGSLTQELGYLKLLICTEEGYFRQLVVPSRVGQDGVEPSGGWSSLAQGREMIITVLQIAVVPAVALYLGRMRMNLHRRNTQTWESILARLRKDWSGRTLSDHYLWKEGLSIAPEEAWERMKGVRGLWAMYHNAGVMVEMADYAARNAVTIDHEIVLNLRNDAIQIRARVLKVLAQYAMEKASEGVRMNAFQAASIYTGMAARMTELLQDNAADMLPSFVAAM
jgi:hypothetical protein